MRYTTRSLFCLMCLLWLVAGRVNASSTTTMLCTNDIQCDWPSFCCIDNGQCYNCCADNWGTQDAINEAVCNTSQTGYVEYGETVCVDYGCGNCYLGCAPGHSCYCTY